MYFKQVKEIVSGAKRCTQRVQKRGDVAAYEALWRTINKSRGVRWEDNPVVWRLWFEFVG